MSLFVTVCLASVVVILGLSSLPSPAWLIVGLPALIAPCIFATSLRPAVLGGLVAILMLSVAFLELSARQLRESEVGVDTRIVVEVTSVPQRDARSLRFAAQLLECLSCKQPLGPQRLQLSWYGATPIIRAGDRWQLTVRLKPMKGLRNPGGFDRARWAAAHGIHARGYVRSRPVAERLSAASGYELAAIRQRLADGLANLASANDSVALVQALTLGVRHGVSEVTWQVLRESGTAHLLAISGLHITLLAGWTFIAVRGLTSLLLARCAHPESLLCGWDARATALLASLLVAIAYALLAGFGLPAQRAVIMLAVWVIAGLRCRVLGATTGLSVALLAVMLHNPLSVLTVGFWLSFGTVAALFFLHEGHLSGTRTESGTGVRSRFRRLLDRAGARLLPALRTHLSLGILLLPVTAWFFQSGSLLAPLANLLAVPWVGAIVVPLCFLALLCSLLLPSLAAVFLSLAQWSIDVLLAGLGWLIENLAGAITLVMPSVMVTLLSAGGLLLLFSPRGLGVRWLALPLLVPALAFNLHRPPLAGFETHVLDVGQGLAVLVYTDEQTILFDTGGKVSDQLSMFEAVVMPFLLSTGRRHIDTLVVSHTDEDHSFGLQDVLQRFPDIRLISSAALPGTVWLPTAAETKQVDGLPVVEACRAGMQWQDGETVFSFLHPGATDAGTDNDRSCVMMVHNGASRVLLTGDIEATAEARIVKRLRAVLPGAVDDAQVLHVDMMTAPHHGSRTSSTDAFLATIRPEHVVFPAGHGNRYGFPHVEVQSRYLALGVTLFTTGTEGAVSFSYGRTGVDHTPSSWWHSHRRFWHGIINSACSAGISEEALGLRLLKLAHEGHELCGKLSLRAAG